MMPKQQSNLVGRLEWLKSVSLALTGTFGALLLALGYEIVAMISNPHEALTHFAVALMLLVMASWVLVLKIAWDPISLGIDETKAKLVFINWKRSVSKVEMLLMAEEELMKQDEQNAEEQPAVDHRIDGASITTDRASGAWSPQSVTDSTETRTARIEALKEKLESDR